MSDQGILLLGEDEVIESRAQRHGVAVQVGTRPAVPFEKTLITVPGVRVPWELLPAAWGFLEQWDAAVPLWRYDVTAAQVGTAEERELTREIIRDLRVLLHSVELLFVRNSEQGQALVEAWQEECASAGSTDGKRLAFLRAVYRVKPHLCVLPTSWLAEVRPVNAPSTNARLRQRSLNAGKPLVTVEVEPGRLVKCHAGDEERVLAHFRRQRAGRK